jgi:hypothetical protein
MVATSVDAPTSAAGPLCSLLRNATRATPRGLKVPNGVQDANRPSAEAPRPAHDRIDGRSPGSRVAARHRLPGTIPVALWFGLAAYSCGGSCGIGIWELMLPSLHRIPCSLSRERPSIAAT